MKQTLPTRTQCCKLHLNQEQRAYLIWLAGARRFICNWAIGQSDADYALYKEGLHEYPTEKVLNAEFREYRNVPGMEWLYKVPACVYQHAIKDVYQSYRLFIKALKDTTGKLKKKHKHPNRYKKHKTDSFYVSNDWGYIKNGKFKCPGLREHIKVEESPWSGTHIQNYIVKCRYGEWYVCITHAYTSSPKPVCIAKDRAVGVDLGIAAQVTLSTGEQYRVRDTSKLEQKMKYQQRYASRAKEGSNNQKKRQRKLQATYKRLANQRNDDMHKITTTIAKNQGIVVLEALDIQAMVNQAKWRSLRRSLVRAAMGEFRRQLLYKCQQAFEADPFFPSSQICSRCRHRHKMPLNVRTYVCPECGLVIDRDVNAAKNLLAQYISGRVTPVVSC